MNKPKPETDVTAELKTQVTIIATFIAIFWVVEALDQFVFRLSPFTLGHCLLGGGVRGCTLDRFGIIPHYLIGLRGVIFAPFLHGSWGHLISNTVPFAVLAWFVMVQETSDFFIVTLTTMLVGGLGTWVFGASGSIHIGASILIYGYLGFLLLRGYFERNVASIAMAMVVFFLYGGVIWGILPSQPGISWEGHLFGFIGGILAARNLSKLRRTLNN